MSRHELIAEQVGPDNWRVLYRGRIVAKWLVSKGAAEHWIDEQPNWPPPWAALKKGHRPRRK